MFFIVFNEEIELWKDLEKNIYDMIIDRKNPNKKWNEFRRIIRDKYDRDYHFKKYITSTAIDKKNDTEIDLIYINLLLNYNSQDIKKNTKSYKNWILYFKQEMKLFEENFSKYLIKELQLKNTKYKEESTKKINDLFNIVDNISDDSNKESYIMSFNYTPINYHNIDNCENVHGSLADNSIIIGIDSSSINYNDNKSEYTLTKTYRKVENKVNKLDLGTSKLLRDDKRINHIIFFGHSLNEQDYSYFQTIFDKFDLYSSNLNLYFVYSIYDQEEKENIINDQINRVIALIEKYGETLDNKYQGKNLLHKLLNEKRVSIIEKYSTK